MLKNKNILFICKETFSVPFYFLAKELLNENTVASYFFNPPETGFKKCLMNESTFYKHKEINNLIVYDNNDIVQEFTKNLKFPEIDKSYLEKIEIKYTKQKPFVQQILTSQFFSRRFHNRTIYVSTTYEQQIYWLQLNYKKVENIFEEFKPDYIFDLDNSEFFRSVISEVSRYKKIIYINLQHPRYEMYKIYSNSTKWENEIFKKIYFENFAKDKKALLDEYKYINEFRTKSNIMSVEWSNPKWLVDNTANYEKDSLFKILKNLFGKIIYDFNLNYFKGSTIFKKKNKIFYPNTLKFISFFLKFEIKRWYLLGKNKYFSIPRFGEKYVYMPLHLIPESSTFVHAPYYINEIFLIEQISKSLPLGLKLYVKEHQAMLGERPLSFYKKVNSLSNVKLMQVNYYKDPKPWIVNSECVVTITGTTAYEAALLGKPSIIFGDMPFNYISSITKISDFNDLPNFFRNLSNIENIHSCAAYIAAVKHIGNSVNLNLLMIKGEKILLGLEKIDQEFENEINNLKLFFLKSLKFIENMQCFEN